MKCTDFKHSLNDWLDCASLHSAQADSARLNSGSELPAELRDHARTCADCTQQLSQHQLLLDAVSAWKAELPAVDLADLVLARASFEQPAGSAAPRVAPQDIPQMNARSANSESAANAQSAPNPASPACRLPPAARATLPAAPRVLHSGTRLSGSRGPGFAAARVSGFAAAHVSGFRAARDSRFAALAALALVLTAAVWFTPQQLTPTPGGRGFGAAGSRSAAGRSRIGLADIAGDASAAYLNLARETAAAAGEARLLVPAVEGQTDLSLAAFPPGTAASWVRQVGSELAPLAQGIGDAFGFLQQAVDLKTDDPAT